MSFRDEDPYSISTGKDIPFPVTAEDRKICYEENDAAIGGLVALTAGGKIQWTCTDHMPIDTIPGEKRNELELWQCFEVETTYNGHEYKLELMEEIFLPGGCGDLNIDFYLDGDDILHGGTSLSIKYDNYDNQITSRINRQYQSDNITRLYDLIIPSIVGSQAVVEGCSRINTMDSRYSKSIRDNKLFRLCQRLRTAGRALDFHKCVLDAEHRERLYQEYGIE